MCDEQGRTVGVVLADQAFQKLTAENERMKAEMARLQTIVAEREQKIESLYALLEEVAGFTPEELADLEKNGVPFDGRFIKELEGDLRLQEQSETAPEPDEPTIIPDKNTSEVGQDR